MSPQYLTYAKNNRAEWEDCGEEVVAKLVAEVSEEWKREGAAEAISRNQSRPDLNLGDLSQRRDADSKTMNGRCHSHGHSHQHAQQNDHQNARPQSDSKPEQSPAIRNEFPSSGNGQSSNDAYRHTQQRRVCSKKPEQAPIDVRTEIEV